MWYQGPVSDAINAAKSQKAILLVFIRSGKCSLEQSIPDHSGFNNSYYYSRTTEGIGRDGKLLAGSGDSKVMLRAQFCVSETDPQQVLHLFSLYIL